MRAACFTVAIFFSLLPAAQLHSQEATPTQQVAAALEALDSANQDETWQFTLHVTEDEEQRVISHDPSKPDYEQRVLLSINGAPPDDKRQKEFREQEKKRVDERDPEASYRYLVDLSTLAPGATEGGNTMYTFTPRLKQMAKADGKMRGELLFDEEAGAIDSISISSIEAFSPAFSVTLESYELQFHFRDEGDARLLDSMRSHAVGKAGFVKSFDNEVDVQFTDYEPSQR